MAIILTSSWNKIRGTYLSLQCLNIDQMCNSILTQLKEYTPWYLSSLTEHVILTSLNGLPAKIENPQNRIETLRGQIRKYDPIPTTDRWEKGTNGGH